MVGDMRIWTISDLHVDHGIFWPTIPDADVCVVAGDVVESAIASMEWIRYELKPAMPVIYVLGNHEFYGSSIERELHWRGSMRRSPASISSTTTTTTTPSRSAA